jgi:hypothetical protein
MEMKENDYVLGIWTIMWPTGNFMCSVKRTKNKWKGEGRFRYYRDKKMHDSNDRKEFYGFVIPDNTTEEEIIRKIRETQRNLANNLPEIEKIDELLIQSDDPVEIKKYKEEVRKNEDI